jgi:hypothetical protein
VSGEGLWLVTDTEFVWTMEGEPRALGVEIPLANGWTLLGNPLWFPGELSGIRVDQADTRHSFWEAVDLGLISLSIYGFDSVLSDYVAVDTLQTWHGYWVAGLQDSLALWFGYRNFGLGAAPLLAAKGQKALTGDQWRVTVDLDDGEGHTAQATFGIDPAATAGFDARYDLPEPPVSPAGPRARLVFPHPEWQLAIGRDFRADVVGPTAEPLLWQARVDRPTPGPVTLSWDSSSWPLDLDLRIVLPGEQVVVPSMRQQSEVTLHVATDTLAVQFMSLDHPTDIGDLEITEYRLRVHPNPFNPATEIAFDVPYSGEVEVRIYNLRGMLVQRLQQGVVTPGRYRVTWRGRDVQGRSVASGIYFAVLWADGQQAGPIQKMSLVR